ncbi:MAG: hypothetical protein AAGN35_02455 [Bacteroidota bacterium]
MKIIKYGLLLLFVSTLALPASAQKKKKGDAEPAVTAAPSNAGGSDLYTTYEKMYTQGLRYNDLAISTHAMHAMIALRPRETALKDSLSRLYFQRGAWAQCILVGTEVLQEQPENNAVLELRAVSYQSVGLPKESLEDFEKLYVRTKNPYHLYEIATLQFNIRRFGECEASIGRLLQDESIKDKTITLGAGERRQEVPMAAAVLNMRGVVDLEQGKKESAKQYLEAALKIQPDFELAKNNLALIETGK